MPDHEIDRVAMPSLKADGTADQTPGYETLDEDAAKRQEEARTTVAVSNETAAEEGTAEATGEKAVKRPKGESR